MSTTYPLKKTNQISYMTAFQASSYSFQSILLFIVCSIFLPTSLFAQSPKMYLFTNIPEWHGTTVCDNGNGYDPSPINAPSTSYSGNDVKEPLYDYMWEQNDGSGWQIVSSGKASNFVPSFNPANLHNSEEAANTVKNYSWRVTVTDVSNGNQQLTSDVYTLGLAPTIKVVPTISGPRGSKQKYAIDLSVTGGMKNKTYTWVSSTENAAEISPRNKNDKDQSGLAYGTYEVTISDLVCASLTLKIITEPNKTNKSQ